MIDVTDETFDAEVMDRSESVPVVVDLWAPWCGPCRQLGPLLERVVGATEGRAELAKVNVDENPRISARFAVQSIPAVYAVSRRAVVDGFIGAQPERAVEEFVARLLPTEADLLARRGREEGDESALRQALELDPDNEVAVLALAEMLVARSEADEALDLLKRVPESAEVRQLAARARLERAQIAGPGGEVAERTVEEVLDELIERLPDDEARQRIVDVLETMAPDDPRVATYRRAMTSRLY